MAYSRLGRVLVTGADGFIGSHLVEELVRGGADVTALVMYNAFNSWGWLDHSSRELRDAIRVSAADIRDGHAVRAAMRGCDTVLHLAALIAIPYSYIAPEAYVDTNIKGTLNILQAARDLGVRRVVHTSTSEVYGTAQTVPINEEHPLQGQSPYAATKIGADQIALAFHRSFDVPVVVIRPFNTYGPRQSARAIIPTVITQIAQGRSRIDLGSLTPTRDFSYVTDTASGLIAGALASDAALGEVINLGSNFEITIGDTVRLIADLMGTGVTIETDTDRLRPEKSEVLRLWSDNSKATRMLGWRPEHGGPDGLRRGLEKTIAWFTDPTNLARYKTDQYNV